MLIVIGVCLLLGGCRYPEEGFPVEAVIRTDPDPPRGDPPLTVEFVAEVVRGEAAEYIWDFGDGNGARGKTVKHTFPSPGNYGVALRVRGMDGSEDIDTVVVHVNSEKPIVNLHVDNWGVTQVNQRIRFYAEAYDPDGTVMFYHWDFGDGEVATTVSGEVSHSFDEPGRYMVSVRAEDDNGDLSEPAVVEVEVHLGCPCG